jgi:hypothetical protein
MGVVRKETKMVHKVRRQDARWVHAANVKEMRWNRCQA